MRVIGCVVLMTALCGCSKPSLIPNTKVADTKTNREILQVLESYRRAMEKKDAAKVLSLVHPTYRDERSGAREGGDLDYTGVRRVLANRFKLADRVRYRIEYQRLRMRGREALVDAWVDATFVYRQPDVTPRWERLADYNRFHLLHVDGRWQIISGL